MARTFDFFKETYPAKGYEFGSKKQEQVAKKYKVERVLPFRYAFYLPDYILNASSRAGYMAVQLGYTTNRSSTWGFYKKKYLLIKAVPAKGGYILKAENGDLPDGGNCVYASRKDAYDTCRKMYPSNGVWEGQKVRNGYKIRIHQG